MYYFTVCVVLCVLLAPEANGLSGLSEEGASEEIAATLMPWLEASH